MLSSELGCNMRYIKFLSRLIFKPIYIRYEKIIDKLNELDDAIEKNKEEILAIDNNLSRQENRMDSFLSEIRKLDVIERNTTIISKKLVSKKNTILFLIHNANSWYSICEIYHELKKHSSVEVITVTINKRFPGSGEFYGARETGQQLERLGISNIIIDSNDSDVVKTLLITLSPDVIIRQSPWDQDIPSYFSAKNLSFAKLCYIPYFATNVVKNFVPNDEFDFQSNQEFHNLCWRIYTDSLLSLHDARLRSLLGGFNVRYFGNAKLEYIVKAANGFEEKVIQDRLTIIWAPHHSIDENWLGFATFPENYKDFLSFAKNNHQHKFILRPHPALFSIMEARYPNEMAAFVAEWTALQNTVIDNDFDYLKTFEESDLMITDGISFLVEYPLTNKPIIYMDSGHHAEFNEIGLIAVNCAYHTKCFSEIEVAISKAAIGELNPKIEMVGKLKESLMLEMEQSAARKIVNDMLDSL